MSEGIAELTKAPVAKDYKENNLTGINFTPIELDDLPVISTEFSFWPLNPNNPRIVRDKSNKLYTLEPVLKADGSELLDDDEDPVNSKRDITLKPIK